MNTVVTWGPLTPEQVLQLYTVAVPVDGNPRMYKTLILAMLWGVDNVKVFEWDSTGAHWEVFTRAVFGHTVFVVNHYTLTPEPPKPTIIAALQDFLSKVLTLGKS